MSIVTKIAIVILCLLVLVAVPVFVQQATVPANYRKEYENELAYRKTMEQTARTARIALNRANFQIALLRATSQQDVLALQSKIDEKEAEIASVKLRNSNLQQQLSIQTANLGDLAESHKQNVKQRERLQESLATARGENKDLASKNRQLEATINSTQADVERLEKLVRVYREQLAEKDRQLADLNERLIDATRGQASAAVRPTGVTGSDDVQVVPDATGGKAKPISGRVTAVRNGLASINIGASQGVKRGDKLIIYRGAKLVGYLTIQEVEDTQAAGMVTDKVLDVAQNDRVTTMLQR